MNADQSPLVRIVRTVSWTVLAASLLGVALHVDPTAADPLAPKAFWFAVAAGFLAVLAALQLWLGGTLRLPSGRLALAWGLVLAAAGLAYVLSPLREHAQESWQAWVLLALLFVGAFDLLEGEAAWSRSLRVLSVVALLAGLWSAAQSLGLDHSAMGLACKEAFGPRIAGSLGNPNFAGGFFVLLLPVLVWSAWREPQRWARILGGSAAVFAGMGLLLSASKAALLGLAAEAAVAGHLVFWSDAAGPLKRRSLLTLAGAIVAVAIIGWDVLPAASRQRLLDGWKPGAESIQFRQQTWAGALQAAVERPVLGWGPGNFSVVYPGHRLPQTTAGLAQRSYEVTHAENWVLQTLVETGSLGLLALVFLLLCLTWPLRLAAKAWDQGALAPSLALALCTALLGSLACNLASLDLYLPSTLLPFCLLGALAARVAGLPVFAPSIKAEGYVKVLAGLGLLLFATVPPLQARMRWQASRDLAEAKSFSEAGRFDEAIPLYQRALYLHPGELEARYFLASSYQDRAQGTDQGDAEREYEELRRQAPDYVLVHAKLARLYTAEGRLDVAAEHWERQLVLDPYLLQGIQALSSLYAGQGHLQEARTVLSAAVLRYPERADLRQNLQAVEAAIAKKGKHP
jgi:O-antigen ligase/tetratricopeptide (TPR) repeat protein